LGLGATSWADPVATPVLSQASGTSRVAFEVDVTCVTSGATIYYTTDGTAPTTGSAVVSGPVAIDRSCTLKAKAYKTGETASEVAEETYQVTGAIAAGIHHNLVLRSDGVVFGWGGNDRGQLGTDDTDYHIIPVPMINGEDVMAIATSFISEHSLVLKTDGTVWSVGSNDYGQLGDNTTTERHELVEVGSSFDDVVDIAAGGFHSLALKSDGTVWAWGKNASGQLGNNSTTDSSVPVQVGGLTSIVAIACGEDYSLALKSDGTLWVWGDNSNGQLGDNSTTNRDEAYQVMSGVAAVTAGRVHTLVLKNDGSAVWWAYRGSWRLGDGSTTGSLVPVEVEDFPEDVIAISAGGEHNLALRSDGTLVAWGYNEGGQLGDGTTTDQTTPVAVEGISDVTMISGGFLHSLAVTADGIVRAWGQGDYAQLGDGLWGDRLTPGPVAAVQLILTEEDSDFDGLPDAWEMVHFGDLDENGRDHHDDDGLVDWQEYQAGTDPLNADTDGDGEADHVDLLPLDYYNGVTPTLTKVSGDEQDGEPQDFLAQPFLVRVVDGSSDPLVNAPVIFTVTAGGGHLAAAPSGTPTDSSVEIRTDEDGYAEVWFYGSASLGENTIEASAGTETEEFTATTVTPTVKRIIFIPERATLGTARFISVRTLTAGATIRYTTDGSTPTESSPSVTDGMVEVDHNLTLKAKGFKTGYNASAVTTVAYQITGEVAAGEGGAMVLKSDGTVYTWGDNSYGQLNREILSNVYLNAGQAEDFTDIVAVAFGNKTRHSLGLTSSGTVVACGYNEWGQLGDGTTTDRETPVAVTGLSGVVSVMTGTSHSLALKSDGTVVTWGKNDYGQLGDGTFDQQSSPVEVEGLTNVVALGGGGNFSVALRADGTVWTWGDNSYGQLGLGSSYEAQANPVMVPGITNAVAISVGGLHTLVLTQAGDVWAWGYNGSGQIGDGTQTDRDTPILINGLSDVRQLAAGSGHNLVIKNDGSVWGWGDNSRGELGTGSTTPSAQLTPINTGITGMIQVSCGWLLSVGLKSDGTVWSWGGYAGDIGDGQWSNRLQPVQVPTIRLIPDAGDTDSDGLMDDWEILYFENLDHDGTVDSDGDSLLDIQEYTAGLDPVTYDTDGDGLHDGEDTAPLDYYNGATPILSKVSGNAPNVEPETFAAAPFLLRVLNGSNESYVNAPVTFTVTSGGGHLSMDGEGTPTETAVELRTDEAGYAEIWFYSPSSLGLSTIEASSGSVVVEFIATTITPTVKTPYFLPAGGSLGTARSIIVRTATSGATIHYTTDGSTPTESDAVVTNGGTLSITGTRTLKAKAFKTDYHGSAVATGAYRITGLVAGGVLHSVALKSDGTVWTWGCDDVGQLGLGETGAFAQAVMVPAIDEVMAIATGYIGKNTLALKSDGTVWGWGANERGQLGDGSTVDRNTPVRVGESEEFDDVVAIAMGSAHGLALKSDGTVWGWGYNEFGQLGNGSTDNETAPVQVSGLTDMVAIACGTVHSMALKSDGTLYVWGNGGYDQLGDGETGNQLTPKVILTGVTGIAAYHLGSMALKSDGTVWSWGYNVDGELGQGTTENQPMPTMISGLSDVTAIAAGGYHGLALKNNGTVMAWGYNAGPYGPAGQIGNGSTSNQPSPVQVSGLTEVVSIAGGQTHSLAVKSDGTVWAWGNNALAQLGDGTTTNRYTPVQVPHIRLIVVPGDSDRDAIMDAWETQYFDDLEEDGTGDFDSDGLTDWQEYKLGTDPTEADTDGDGVNDGTEVSQGTSPLAVDSDGDGQHDNVDSLPLDYYNAVAPTLVKTSGDGQNALPSTHVLAPLVVRVTDGTNPLVGAPVVFTVTDGTAQMAPGPVPPSSAPQTVLTDADGYAQIFVWYPAGVTGTQEITVTAGEADPVTFTLGVGDPIYAAPTEGLALWLKAEEAQMEISDGKISAWHDQSGGEHDAVQATTGLQPTLVEDVVDGKDAVEFDGEGQFLAGSLNLSESKTFAVVVKDLGTTNAIGGVITAKEGSDFNGIFSENGTKYVGDYAGANSEDSVRTTQPINAFNVVLVRYDQALSKMTLYQNGRTETVLTRGGEETTGFELGTRNNELGRYFKGQVAEVLVYDRSLSDAEVVQLSGYLAQKYEIALVPDDSDHDGLPDVWEGVYWENLEQEPEGDWDGDGFSNLAEYQNGTDPTYYNVAQQPQIEVISGNDQFSQPETFGPEPLVVRIKDYLGSPLAHTTVRFTVTQGTIELATTNVGAPTTESTYEVETDEQGLARIHVWYADDVLGDQNVKVQCGVAYPVFFLIHVDSDRDDLPDDWELNHFGSLEEDGAGDFDEDGFTNLEEYQGGTEPNSHTYTNQNKVLVMQGSGQIGTPLSFLSKRLLVRLVNAHGDFIPNATVHFFVTHGSAKLSTVKSGTPTVNTLDVETNALGYAEAYVWFPEDAQYGTYGSLNDEFYPETFVKVSYGIAQKAEFEVSVDNDLDNDELPDLWELDQFGSLDQTGLDDADGDGYPNFFEYKKETDPMDANEKPASDLVVDASGLSGDFDNIQEAIDSTFESSDPYCVIEVLPGTYEVSPSAVNGSVVESRDSPYSRVLLIASGGAASTIIDGSGMENPDVPAVDLSYGQVIEGFTIKNANTGIVLNGARMSRCIVEDHEEHGVVISRTSLMINCLVRHNGSAGVLVAAATNYADQFTTERITHCEIIDNAEGIDVADGGGENGSGAAKIENCIVKNDGVEFLGLTTPRNLTLDHCIAENFPTRAVEVWDVGYVGGGNQVIDPLLDSNGVPANDSPALDHGQALAVNEPDFNYQARPLNHRVDVGAFEVAYVDSDTDGLPDFWEIEHFGAINHADAEAGLDPDSDDFTNLEEFLQMTDPNDGAADTDGDDLPDAWEIEHFHYLDVSSGSIVLTEPDGLSDFDHDGISDYAEFIADTDPTNLLDKDEDGLPDSWEIHYFDTIDHADATAEGDPDRDGQINSEEYANGTNPKDFFDNYLPSLSIDQGNYQRSAPETFLAQPLRVRVMRDAWAGPSVETKVVFHVEEGAGLLATTNVGPYDTDDTIEVETDFDGYAEIYYLQPDGYNVVSQISATVNEMTNATIIPVQFTASTYRQAESSGSLPSGLPSTDLVLCLMADNSVDIDDDKVSEWHDLSGNVNTAYQVNETKRPTLVADVFGTGKPALRFANGQFLKVTDAASLRPTSAVTIIAISHSDASSTQQRRLVSQSSYALSTSAGHSYGVVSTGGFHEVDGETVDRFGGQIRSLVYDSSASSLKLYFDGDEVDSTEVSGDLSYATNSDLLIGAGSSEAFEGDIGTILIYDRALTALELEEAEAWLADYYEVYHPAAAWITGYATEIQTAIHANKFTKAQADSYEERITASPEVPAIGLLLWLKADAETGLSDTEPVQTWHDQSGYHHDAVQPEVEKQPVFLESVANGQPAIHFDGSGRHLLIPSSPSLKWNDQMTAVIVAKIRNGAAVARPFFVPQPYWFAHSEYDFILQNNDNRTSGSVQTLTSGTSVSQSTVSGEQRNVFVLRYDGDNDVVHLYQNGVLLGEQTLTGALANKDYHSNVGLFIGLVQSFVPNFSNGTVTPADHGMWGDISEILLYDRALDGTERSVLESSLAEKYGLYHANADWIDGYAGGVQTLIHLHQWTKAQADRYVTLTTEQSDLLPADLKVWLAADGAMEEDAMGGIQLWQDQSAYANDAIALNGDDRPVLVPEALNEKPMVAFEDGANRLVVADSPTLRSTNVTVLVVGRYRQFRPNMAWWVKGDNQGYSAWFESVPQVSGYGLTGKADYAFNGWSGVPNQGVKIAFDTQTATLMELRISGHEIKCYVDGELIKTYESPTAVTASTAAAEIGRFLDGDIAEVMVYGKALSDGERAPIEDYLINKYGLYQEGAEWIEGYDSEVQDEINRQHLNQDETERYVDWLASEPEIPVTGLRLWLKSDADLEVDGDKVIAWRDQSVHQNDALAVPMVNDIDRRPTVDEIGMNGLPSLHFDGANDLLRIADHRSLKLKADITVIAVTKRGVNATAGQIVSKPRYPGAWEIGNGVYQLWDVPTGRGAFSVGTTNGASNVVSTNYSVDEDPHVLIGDYNGLMQTAAFDLAEDGEAQNAGGDFTYGELSSDLAIGSRSPTGPGDYFSGDLAELLIFDHKLSSEEQTQIQAYLGTKYGITMLAPPELTAGGDFEVEKEVTMTTTVTGGTIKYTTNGSEPTEASTTYTTALTLTKSTRIKAKVFLSSGLFSRTTTETYYVDDDEHENLNESVNTDDRTTEGYDTPASPLGYIDFDPEELFPDIEPEDPPQIHILRPVTAVEVEP
jgi:alpha-tubulin suppressor-like RCC1 family protein